MESKKPVPLKKWRHGEVKPHTGSRFDDFLNEEEPYNEVQAKALKRACLGSAQGCATWKSFITKYKPRR